jgi:hypothetical protein
VWEGGADGKEVGGELFVGGGVEFGISFAGYEIAGDRVDILPFEFIEGFMEYFL